MSKQYKMYINGEWVNAISGKVFDEHNPATGEIFAKVPCGERPDVKKAIDAANTAWAWLGADTPDSKMDVSPESRRHLRKGTERFSPKSNRRDGFNICESYG